MTPWIPTVDHGFALLPEGPGIGVELVEDAEIKFPFKRRTINTRLHVDGSIVDQ
jgi:galactonate dehydratase